MKTICIKWGLWHLIFLKLIIHMTFSLPQRLNILVIKFKIMDLCSFCNNTANPIICLVRHFMHYVHMWKTLVWPHLWLRNLVEYLQVPGPTLEIDRSCICVMSLDFASVSIIVQVDTHVECKYLFLPFQLKNKACRFHSFIRMSMSCLLHKILQRHVQYSKYTLI